MTTINTNSFCESVATIDQAKFCDRVLAARCQTPGEKIRTAFELFESACSVMRAGILRDAPGLSDDELHQEMQRRFRIARRLDETACYRPVAEVDIPEEWRV